MTVGLPDDSGLLVIGLGASAGGVEALEAFFAHLPAKDIDAAYVIITHVAPHRESLLTDILARQTGLTVATATAGDELQIRHVYVMPADAILTLEGRRLCMRESHADGRERNPIDIFFSALGREQRDNAVGIVLSGAGSDGTLGLKVIKEEGGLTVAQAHNEAGPRHDSMPLSAVKSGVVDLVLPVEQMGTQLREYARSFQHLRQLASEHEHRRGQETFEGARKEICAILRKRVGHNFEGYKEKTFSRRVQRRMQVLQISSFGEYVERLKQENDEASLLFKDLLIGMTSFFRDAEAFEALAEKVIPRLFDNASASDVLRVWVPGCATGEEAYTLAILLREYMSTLDVTPKVQLFATDIDDPGLSVARAGRYPAEMLESVSPERIKRFFRQEGGAYVLAKEIRDMCFFSAHSVIRDPPFSRIDLISCRNLLIYFNAELQDQVLPIFYYALKTGGYLFLGPSESISRHGDLFGAVDKKHRIFQRRATITQNERLPAWISHGRLAAPVAANPDSGVRKDQRLRHVVESNVLEHFAPAHIVVEGDGNIVYYSSRTGKYLEPQMGSPSRQILAMARRGLRLELRSALREAVERRQTVTREHVEIDIDDRVQIIRLTIQPMQDGEQDPLYLVVFSDIGPPLTRDEAAHYRPTGLSSDVSTLEQDLKETRDRLQATIEEYETALEELKSGNEELVSVNEELQSTNEELETSKEELQSVNEELHTVNHELNAKVEELHRANGDLRNLFESAQIATVFLDRNMVIRSYTPAVSAIFNLISSDRGRPITDIAHQLEDVDFATDIPQVLREHKVIERPVSLRNGKSFQLMRILPYRTADDEVDGAVITFADVTPMVVAEKQQRLLVSELNHRVRNMLQVVIGLCHQTLHRSHDLKEFERAFMGRVQALARAYELLSRDGWKNVSIADLLQTELSPFATSHRYSARGEHVMLTADAALSFGLVLYELATNATKYGALSIEDGHIDVGWKVQSPDADGGNGRVLVLDWAERGGPAVAPPTRQGFGSELIQRQLKYELNGQASMDFSPEGLRVTLTVPATDAVRFAEQQEGKGDGT